MTSEEFISQFAEKLQAIGTLHAIGETWFSIDGSIPAGGVPFCGQTVTRAMYADLFAWATAQGKVKTEVEWQSIATANGGNCPYYSDGDGSTTFRMPAVVSYLKGATSASNAGQYEAQGLPEIKGRWITQGPEYNYTSASGAISKIRNNDSYGYGHGQGANSAGFSFSASKSNPIYGNSSDVTPETYTVLIGVYAFSIATNVGNTDIGNLTSALASLETEVNTKLDSSTAHIVDTWKDSQGNWYRVWSDGFIEQCYTYPGNPKTNADISVTFPTQFSTTNYKVLCETSIKAWSNALNADVISGTKSTTGCTLRLSTQDNQDDVNGLSCVAFGY